MKKIIFLCCAVLLEMSLITTAMAAPNSPFPITTTKGDVQKSKADIPAGVENTDNAVQTAVSLGVESTSELSLMTAFEFSGTTGEENLTIAGAANRRVVLLHYYNSAWEVAYDGYADSNGTIYFELNAFSPFAVLLGNVLSGESTSSEVIGDNVEALKTTDSFNPAIILILIICCLAVAYYVFKRTKSQKHKQQ